MWEGMGLSKVLREKRFKTRSVEGTLALGETLAEIGRPPMRVRRGGQGGAGKTTLVKGIARALGAAYEEDVTSPTFTLVHEYEGPKVHLFHLDLYRLETEEQIAVLGLEEMMEEPNALVLVEWGERFESVVALADGEIAMEHGEGDERGMIVRWKA
jgi:tRNA threonylcarbamoyladenosine biosynthesis protein TsaE